MSDSALQPETPSQSPSAGKVSSWWEPSVHADRRPFLLARNRIQAALRQWFAAEDFIEVDPCQLQISPGNETHLHAFRTASLTPWGEEHPLYLHTSPEFACKKLLAAGESRIACFSHVFRNRERGPLHHPEFTMLEWYRAGAPYTQLMEDCQMLVRRAAEAAGRSVLSYQGHDCPLDRDFERLSVAEAFERHAGIDLMASLDAVGTTDAGKLAESLDAAGIRHAPDDSWSDMFSRVIVEKIEPNLGFDRLTILDRYPVSEAALARRSPEDGRVAERFEVYACGVELANAFGELTDPFEQRLRFTADMMEKERLYGETYPLDEDFLDALSLMPEASGIAVGFDRLVMLASGALRIDQVLWSPVPDLSQ